MSNELYTIQNTQLANAGIEELFKSWANFIEGSKRTVDTYTKAVQKFILYLKANGINNPTAEDVKAYREELKINHKPTTVQSYIMAVKQFFKWTEEEHIYPNIARNVKGAKIDREHKKDNLTRSQAQALLTAPSRNTLKGKRDYAIFMLMLTAGLRTIEVQRANIEDLRTVADYTALFLQGKGHDEKTQQVKVAPQVETAIREYLQARGKADPTEPLFSSCSNHNNNDRMTTRSISRLVKENLRQAGIDSERLTAHSLRHTAITYILLTGGTIEEAQQVARHTNINTTMIYNHALTRANNNSENRVADFILQE